MCHPTQRCHLKITVPKRISQDTAINKVKRELTGPFPLCPNAKTHSLEGSLAARVLAGPLGTALSAVCSAPGGRGNEENTRVRGTATARARLASLSTTCPFLLGWGGKNAGALLGQGRACKVGSGAPVGKGEWIAVYVDKNLLGSFYHPSQGLGRPMPSVASNLGTFVTQLPLTIIAFPPYLPGLLLGLHVTLAVLASRVPGRPAKPKRKEVPWGGEQTA